MKNRPETNLIKILPINHIDANGRAIYSDVEIIGADTRTCEEILRRYHTKEKRVISFDVIPLFCNRKNKDNSEGLESFVTYRDN